MRAIFISIFLIQIACYSFKGISIDPEVNSFYVETFEDGTGQIPPGYNEIFSEALVQKVITNTRLDLSESNSDIVFSGKFTRFRIAAEDPGRNTQTNLNRLYVTISVDFYNQKTEEEWTKSYKEVQDFDASANFTDIEDELLEAISEKIIESIFNDAFTNW